MPISGPSSYVSTVNEFSAHWALVNTALGADGPLLLTNPDGPVPPTLNRANLVTYRGQLQAKQAEIQGQINAAEIAGADLKAMRDAIHLRMLQFNEKVRGVLGNTAFVAALPGVPGLTEGQGNFVPPLDDIATLWEKINAAAGIPGFTAPLLLLNAYPRADFDTALAGLKTQFETVGDANLGVTLKIAERNLLQDVIYPVLKKYRQMVPTAFAANSPLIASLPQLTPTPGSTPDPVRATGVWDAPTTQGKITWTASPAADLDKYEVRWSPGTSYKAQNEVVLGTIEKDATREFFTTQGLGAVNDESVFKVYVMTVTGNEKGSNVVKIKRV